MKLPSNKKIGRLRLDLMEVLALNEAERRWRPGQRQYEEMRKRVLALEPRLRKEHTFCAAIFLFPPTAARNIVNMDTPPVLPFVWVPGKKRPTLAQSLRLMEASHIAAGQISKKIRKHQRKARSKR